MQDSELARKIKNGKVFGPHNLHPKLPIAVESVPAEITQTQKQTEGTVDCSSIDRCSQGAWSDFGLGLAGLIPKANLCR